MNEIFSGQRVLVLAPHTDDGEIGCGGSIVRFIEANSEVTYVAFSIAEESMPAGMPKDSAYKEVCEATKKLGIKPENLLVNRFPVRQFPQYRQDILEILIKLSREYAPDIVFLPSTFDTHQDHQVISNEGFRAFKKTTLLGYEVPWNNLTFRTNSFISITEQQLETKIGAIESYISQLGREYVNEEFIRAWARVRGVQIDCKYAESFEVIRWVSR